MSPIGFKESLKKKAKEGFLPVVADFKCVSPGEGRLFEQEEAPALAEKMVQAGAPAISVVTEEKEFGGSLSLLEKITDRISIPVLRKDFVKSKEDISVTKKCGAKAILLICACMEKETLRMLYDYSLEIGIEPFVETHNLEEMEFAKKLNVELVGINNRDILLLEKDGGTVNTTVGLADKRPKGAFLISESGILTPEDAERAVQHGADAILVGTAIWKADNPFAFYRRMMTCIQ